MKSVCVITDSNSGITQSQAKELGISVVPMPFLIGDKTYYEDINLSQEEFYELLKKDYTISTSQPSPEEVCSRWDAALKEAESVVYIPMSSGLSGSCQTALMLAEDYNGKVQVVNNQRISVPMRHSVMDAVRLAEAGYSAARIREILERDKFLSSIYITLDTLTYLKKGGRLTPAVAALGTALRIKPVLQIQGERLDTFAIARTGKQGFAKMLAALDRDIETRFGGLDNLNNLSIDMAYTDNRELAVQYAEELAAHFGIQTIHMDPLSLSVSCHIGPGALGIGVAQNIPEV